MMGKRRKDQLYPAIILLLTIAGLNGNQQGQFNIPTSGTVNLLVSPNASQPVANNSSSNQTDSAGDMFIAPPSADTIRDLLQRFPLPDSNGTYTGNFALPTESLQSGSAQPPSSSNVNILQSSPEIANTPMTNPPEQVNILRIPFGAASPIDPTSPPTIMHNIQTNTVSFGFSLPLTEMGAQVNEANLTEAQTSQTQPPVAAPAPVNNNNVFQPQSTPLFNVQDLNPSSVQNLVEGQTFQTQPTVAALIPSNNNNAFQPQPTPLFNVQDQNPTNVQNLVEGQTSQTQPPVAASIPSNNNNAFQPQPTPLFYVQDQNPTNVQNLVEGQTSQTQPPVAASIPSNSNNAFQPQPTPLFNVQDQNPINPQTSLDLTSAPVNAFVSQNEGIPTSSLLTTADIPPIQTGLSSTNFEQSLPTQSTSPNFANFGQESSLIPPVSISTQELSTQSQLPKGSEVTPTQTGGLLQDLGPIQPQAILDLSTNFGQGSQFQSSNIPITDLGQVSPLPLPSPTASDLRTIQPGSSQGILTLSQSTNLFDIQRIQPASQPTNFEQGGLTQASPLTIPDLPQMQSGPASYNFDQGFLAPSQSPNIPNSLPTNTGNPATDFGQGAFTQSNPLTIPDLPPMQSGPESNNFDLGLVTQPSPLTIPDLPPMQSGPISNNFDQGLVAQPSPLTIPDLPPMQSGPISNNFDQGLLAQSQTPNMPTFPPTNIGTLATDFGQGVSTQSNPLTIPDLPPMQSGPVSNNFDQFLLAQSQSPNNPTFPPTNTGSPATDFGQGSLSGPQSLSIPLSPSSSAIPDLSQMPAGFSSSSNFGQSLPAQPEFGNIPNLTNELPVLDSTLSSQSLQNPDYQQINNGQPFSPQLPPSQQQISGMPTLPTLQPGSQPQQLVGPDQMISQQGIYTTKVSGSQQTGFTNTLTNIPMSLSHTEPVSAPNSQAPNPIQDFSLQQPNFGQVQHQSTNVRQYSPPPPSTNIPQSLGDQSSPTPKVPQQFPSSQEGPWSQPNPQVQPLPHLNQDIPALQPIPGDISYQSNANTATGSTFKQLQQHPTDVTQNYLTPPSANMPNYNSPTPQPQQFPSSQQSPWSMQNPQVKTVHNQLQSLPNRIPALPPNQQVHPLPYPGDLIQVPNAHTTTGSVFNKPPQQSTNVRQSSPTPPSANMPSFPTQQFPSSQNGPWPQPNPQQSNSGGFSYNANSTPDLTFNQPRYQSINYRPNSPQQSSTNMQSIIPPQYLGVQGSPTSQIRFQSSIRSPWPQPAHVTQSSDKSGRNDHIQRQLQFQSHNIPSQHMNYAQQPSTLFNHQALFHQQYLQNSPPSSILSSTPPTNIPSFYSQNSRKSINNKQWEKYGALEALLDASPVHVLREVELAGRTPLKNLQLHTSLAAQVQEFKNLPTPLVQIPTKTGHAIPDYSTQNIRMSNHMTQGDPMSPQMTVSLQTNESMQMPTHTGQLTEMQNHTSQPIHMQTQNSQNRQMLTQSFHSNQVPIQNAQANWMPIESARVGRVPTQIGQFLQNQAAQPMPLATQRFQNEQMPSQSFQSIQTPRQNAQGSGMLIQSFQSMQMPTDLVSHKPNQNTSQRSQQTMQSGQLPILTAQTNQANQLPTRANKTETIINKPQEPMARSLGIPDRKAILYSNTNELPLGAAQVQRPNGNNMMMNMLMMQQMESLGLPMAKIASMLSPRPTAPPPVRPNPTGSRQNINLGYFDPVMREFIPNQAVYGPEIALPKPTTAPNRMSLSNQYQNPTAGNLLQTKSNGVFQDAIALIEQARLNAWFHIKRIPKSTILNQFYEWKRNLGRGNLPPVIPEFLQYLKETLTKMAPMYMPAHSRKRTVKRSTKDHITVAEEGK